MQSILVPTDFSVNADNALAYACELAKTLHFNIVLFHTYQIPVPVADMMVVPFSEEEIRKNVLDNLRHTKDKFRQKNPELQFETEAIQGSLELLMNTVIARHQVLYVVMGTKGASGVAEVLMGTNAATIMENANCPVICIPENAQFTGLKKIVLTADYGRHNFKHAFTTIELAKHFSAEVTILHITSSEPEAYFEDRELLLFRNKLMEKSNYQQLYFKLNTDNDVYHGVNSFIDEYKADLLIISMRSRSIWQKFFHRSLTKRMAYHSHLPVMALHIEENN